MNIVSSLKITEEAEFALHGSAPPHATYDIPTSIHFFSKQTMTLVALGLSLGFQPQLMAPGSRLSKESTSSCPGCQH